MNIVLNWSTSELLDFLNSYHRNKGETIDLNINYEALKDMAIDELSNRSHLLSIPYKLKEGN